jgi:hypothetical protein
MLALFIASLIAYKRKGRMLTWSGLRERFRLGPRTAVCGFRRLDYCSS